jgi:hypothetical protein
MSRIDPNQTAGARASEPLRQLQRTLSALWPQLRHGGTPDPSALEAAIEAADRSLGQLEEAKSVEMARSLASRVGHCAENLHGCLDGQTGFDPLSVRAEVRTLISEASSLARRLRHAGRRAA